MANAKPLTLDHLKSTKKPVVKKYWLCSDPEVAEEHEEAQRLLNVAKARHRIAKDPDEKAITSRKVDEEQIKFDDAVTKLRKIGLVMKFKSIGYSRFDKLVTAHPPTTAQMDEIRNKGGDPAQLNWNPDTFLVALLASCALEPVMTEQDVRELQEDERFNQAEIAGMFAVALEANMTRYEAQLERLGNGSSGTNGSSTS